SPGSYCLAVRLLYAQHNFHAIGSGQTYKKRLTTRYKELRRGPTPTKPIYV
ncbi:hypothetical protein L917_00341, partial [Phytophthora nicotianae]